MALGDAKSGPDVDPTLRPDSRLAFRRPGRQTHGAHWTQGIIFADVTASPVDHVTDLINQQRYQVAVWYLKYVMIRTRLDIAFALSAVSQYSHNAGPSHSTAVIRIFPYLSGTRTHGIMYAGGEYRGYTDAHWGAGEDRKSIGGYVFLMNRGAISWASKKQTSVV